VTSAARAMGTATGRPALLIEGITKLVGGIWAARIRDEDLLRTNRDL
jgi:hypothetical protein